MAYHKSIKPTYPPWNVRFQNTVQKFNCKLVYFTREIKYLWLSSMGCRRFPKDFWSPKVINKHGHHSDLTMGVMASQITSVSIVYSTVGSASDQRKHQKLRVTAMAFVGRFTGDRWFPRTEANDARKMFPFYDVNGLFNRLFRLNQRKHQNLRYRPLVRKIHWWPVDSPHKGKVTRKTFPWNDVIMEKGSPQAWDSSLNPLSTHAVLCKGLEIWSSIDQSHRYGRHRHDRAACRDPVGSYDKTTRTAICFEHKAQYLLIRAPYTRIVVFWHISNIPPMISQSQISCNTPTFYITVIFVKYCFTTGSWLL